VSGLRQPGGVGETTHALRAAWHGALGIDPASTGAIDRDDDDRVRDRARRDHGALRKRPRSGPSAPGEPVVALALRAPAADAHLLGDGVIVSSRGREVVTSLRGRAPPPA
jgi:hypothetical protein